MGGFGSKSLPGIEDPVDADLNALEVFCTDDNKLGQGGVGAVYRGKFKDVGDVAIKKTRFSRKKEKEFNSIEPEILYTLKHPHLIKFHRSYQSSKVPYR